MRNGSFKRNFATRHRSSAEFFLQSHDAKGILFTRLKDTRYQEQPETACSSHSSFGTCEQCCRTRIGVRAKPLFTEDSPLSIFEHGPGRDSTYVRTAFLLGHELTTLQQFVKVVRQHAREILLLQFLGTKSDNQVCSCIRHVDRAAETELGLIEEVGEGVLGNQRHWFRPSQSSSMAKCMDFKVTVRRLFQLSIGRVILDRLPVPTVSVSWDQLRWIGVRQLCMLIEVVRDSIAQVRQMWFDVRAQVRPEISGQQRSQRSVILV